MTMQIREPVLLTGAGFTRNFGGFLANQMWDKIFNHEQVQHYPSLINLLKDNFDFESVYNEVMDGNGYPPEARVALQQAVKSVYDQLDDATRNYWGPSAYASLVSQPLVNWQGFSRLLEHFASEEKARGYIFTLNQDLFVERWHSGDKKLLRILSMTPGVDFKGKTPWFSNASNYIGTTSPWNVWSTWRSSSRSCASEANFRRSGSRARRLG